MTRLAVEDSFKDIIGKAQKGLGISTEILSGQTDVSGARIREIRKGMFDESAVESLAKVLGLNVAALMEIARDNWYPMQPNSMDGFERISTPFYEWSVNSYLIWDPETKIAAVFDTGTDPNPLIEKVDELGLKVETLFVTHTHWDHIEGIDALREAWKMRIVVNKHESNLPEGAELIREGFETTIGNLRVEVLETTGHTSGGTTYIVKGLTAPIAVVGDALFAGSMGGPSISYRQCLAGVRQILSLDDETVLAPGHGPLTTVVEEKVMNCFYVV